MKTKNKLPYELELIPDLMKHEEKHYIYFLCQNEKLVYVGMTQLLDTRIRKHKKNKDIKFDSVYHIYVDKSIASEVETAFIRMHKPMYNKSNVVDRFTYQNFAALAHVMDGMDLKTARNFAKMSDMELRSRIAHKIMEKIDKENKV